MYLFSINKHVQYFSHHLTSIVTYLIIVKT